MNRRDEDLRDEELRDVETLPSGEAAVAEVRRRLQGRRPALLLDYDGTLTPIVERPEDATLRESIRDLLRRLSRLCFVAVVSGRDRADVKKMVDLEELVFAGSHGYDITGPNGLKMENELGAAALPDLDAAERELNDRIAAIPGARVERKRFAIAVHYRQVERGREPQVEQAARDVKEMHPKLRLKGGKKIWELQPDVEWDKGRAVLWLLDHLGLDRDDILPIYMGDDVTDEDAFRALQGRGIGVLVGRPEEKTRADVLLEDVDEVEQFLRGLAEELESQRS